MQEPNETTLGPVLVVVYDRSDVERISGLTLRERIAACYRWADARGYEVIDEFVAGCDAQADPMSALTDVIAICAGSTTHLLVYSTTCISTDTDLLYDLAARLGDSLLTVQPAPEKTQSPLSEGAV